MGDPPRAPRGAIGDEGVRVGDPGNAQQAWKAGRFSFDDLRVRVGAAERAALRRACETGAEHHVRDGAPSVLVAAVDRLREKYVDGWPGAVILTGFDALPPDHWQTAFSIVSHLVGDFVPQDSSGLRIRVVRNRGTRIGEGDRARYSDSRFGGSLHTDGAQLPLPVPDYFTLFCVRRAVSGGAFRMVCLSTVLDRLSRRAADAPAVLRRPFHFDRRGEMDADRRRTARKPVLFSLRGEPAITYLREYIDSGHACEEACPLGATERAALDALDATLNEPDLAVEGYLNPGELLILNNTRLLHGRTTFVDAEELERQRFMWRIWLHRRQ